MLPTTSAYVLLGKYDTVWYKVSTDIKKGFDSEPVYNGKLMGKQNKIFW